MARCGFIPYVKSSKKRQREIDREKRGTWGAINPVTKRPERSDAYKRHGEKQNIQRYARYARELGNDDHSDGRLLCMRKLDCNEKCHIDVALFHENKNPLAKKLDCNEN
mgnify:CR=1 FL=1